VAGVIEHDRITSRWYVHEIVLHGGEDAIAVGLDRRQNRCSGARLGRGGIGEQHNLGGGKAKLWAGQQISHGLCIVHCTHKILEGAKFAASIGASSGVLWGRSGRLIGVDPDQQGALRLPGAKDCRDEEQRNAEQRSHDEIISLRSTFGEL
jgi:hypothetical protein